MEQRGRQQTRVYEQGKRFFSKSRGRSGRFRGGFSGRAQMEYDRQQAYSTEDRQQLEKEKDDKPVGPTGFVNIKSAKKRDPIKAEVKKINLEKYYRDWLEEERKNVLLDFNLHTESELNSFYCDKIQDVVSRRYHSDERVEEFIGFFKAGICLAICLRLIMTASQSQQNSDLKLKKLRFDLKEFRVPDSYNVMLQAIGKFTDDSFGNVRIVGAMCKAKQKILQGMTFCYIDDWKADFEFQEGGFAPFKRLIDGSIPFEQVIFRDKDSLDYIKFKMESKFVELDKLKYMMPVWDATNQIFVQVPVAPPRFDFANATIASMVDYVKGLELWGTVKVPGSADTVRDVYGSLALFSVLKLSFLVSEDDVGDHYDGLKGTYLAGYTPDQFLTFLGLLDGGKICSSEQIVQNAFTINRVYTEKTVMIMEQEYKFSDLVNNEFGSDAQYIQTQQTKPGRGKEAVPRFRSATKRIIKENVVLGGLFSFVNEIKTKRKLSNNLGTQRNVIIADFVKSDSKYSH